MALVTLTEQEIKLIFDSWAKDFNSNPDTFNALGVYEADYGDSCTEYFLTTYNKIKQGEN